MTRTPPDMETAMSDKPSSPSDDLNTFERYNYASHEGVEIMRWTEEGGFSGPAWDAYQALSALGDPVGVAEALPELVEAAMNNAQWSSEVINEFGDTFDPPEDWLRSVAGKMERLSDTALRVREVAAKLKARP